MCPNEVPAGSVNYHEELRAQLAELMPEVFADGTIDFQKMADSSGRCNVFVSTDEF